MSYDPTLPANNSQIVSLELRNQFNGLKEFIDSQDTVIAAQDAAIAVQDTLIDQQQALIDNLQTQVDALEAQLALTLSMSGDNFSWAWYGPNPTNWRLWKIPSSLNPTTDNFQAWRNLATDSNEMGGDVRTASFEADSGFSYALCAYDDVNDVALAPASNVIAVP